MRSHYGSILKILVILVFVFAVGSVDVFCKKKEMDIEISVMVGLSDGNYICRAGSWTPIYILLDNKEMDLDGYFELKSPDDDRVYQIPFTSPKNSKFLIPSYIRVTGSEGKNEYTLTMHTRDFSMPPELIGVQTLKERDYYVVGLSRQAGALRYLNFRLNRLIKRNLRDDEERIFARFMYGSQYLLPRDSIGYQGVSSLIWDGADLSKISEVQMAALMEWVNCGGRLFLFVGENWQYMKGTELERAMGLQFVGSRLINLDNENEREDEQKKPVVVSIAEGLDGWKTLITLEDIPFIAEKEIGMGRVYYLASRFTEDMPYQDVVINLVKNERAESIFCFARASDCDEMLTGGMNQISKRFKIKLPPLKLVFFFLLTYFILIIPVNYIVFRVLKRVEWAWYVIPFIAILFSGMAYLYAYVNYGKHTDIAEFHLIKARADSRTGIAKSGCIIFSPMKKNVDIKFVNAAMFPSTLGEIAFSSRQAFQQGGSSGSLGGETLLLNFDKSFTLRNYPLYKWSKRSFAFDSIADLGGGIDAKFVIDGGKLDYTITNNTPYRLEQELFISRYGFCKLRDVLRGQNRRPSGGVLTVNKGESKSATIDMYGHGVERNINVKKFREYLGQVGIEVTPYNQWGIQPGFSDQAYDSILDDALGEGGALLVLTTSDYRLDIEGELNESINESKSIIFLQCPIENRDRTISLTRYDFDIEIDPNSPTLLPNTFLPNQRGMSFESLSADGSAELKKYTYGEKTTINFRPKKPVRFRNNKAQVIFKAAPRLICGQNYTRGLSLNSDYDIYAFDHVGKTWEQVSSATLQNVNMPNRFYDPVEGIQIMLRFKKAEIEKLYGNRRRQDYPFKEDFVVRIDNLSVSVTGNAE